jgi:hypothetical protein
MAAKKAKTKIRLQDLKPKKDAKGGISTHTPGQHGPVQHGPTQHGPRPNMVSPGG